MRLNLIVFIAVAHFASLWSDFAAESYEIL
jgi:hypothetical protein